MTETLANAKKTKEIIQKYEFTFQKRFGQNFLIDSHVPEKIVAAAEIGRDDCVLEIGPGIGTLTQYLAREAGRVVAVEIDRMLIDILKETLDEFGNVTVINQDILKVDLTELSNEYAGGRPMKVVANLPYYITTPVVMALLESRAPIRSITVMVQKEVADRMIAGPGTKDYGALSLAVRYYSRPQIVARVPAGCFMPQPKVDSAVVRLDCGEVPKLSPELEEKLFSLIKAAFGQRRKTLANAVGNCTSLPYSREQTAEALEDLGYGRTVRGEALDLSRFIALTEELFRREGQKDD